MTDDGDGPRVPDGDEGTGSGDEGGADDGATVAVALSFEGVVLRMEDPKTAIDDLQKWADYVGVTSERPQHEVNGFCGKRDIHIDFFPGPDAGTMETLRRAMHEMHLDADRHIYVGASARDEAMAEEMGWEYMPAARAADNVGWTLE